MPNYPSISAIKFLLLALCLSGVIQSGYGQVSSTRSDIEGFSDTPIYLADYHTRGVTELYKTDPQSGLPSRLNPPLTFTQNIVSFTISPDRRYVVYLADQHQDEVYELYSTEIASRENAKLSGEMVNGGDVDSSKGSYLISADSQTVMYRADQDDAGNFELFSVPIRGEHNPIKLNSDVGTFGQVHDFEICANSQRVVFSQSQRAYNITQLWSAPIDLDNRAVRLFGDLRAKEQVAGFKIDASNRRVVYRISGKRGKRILSSPLSGGRARTEKETKYREMLFASES